MHLPWRGIVLAISIIGTYATQQDLPHIHNANHIFNAIHSSMRQWGSSLNHNGMSLFIATIPEGTQLYHGTASKHRVNGTEWLAFEPEHALVFARTRPPPGKGGPGHPRGGPPGPKPGDSGWHPPQVIRLDGQSGIGPPKNDLKARHPHDRPSPGPKQAPLLSDEPQFEDKAGYLHTYRSARPLRLLYIDGQSAAKSSLGTLDTQDIVLLHDTPPPRIAIPINANDLPKKSPPGGMNEMFRANELCRLAITKWEDRIDGFIRMELGFEIIFCSFARDLAVERITATKPSSGSGLPGRPGDHRKDPDQLSYYRAVAARFDGIGGERVRLDYENFVSMFAEGDEVVEWDEERRPRARNSTSALQPVRQKIDAMVLNIGEKVGTNWQAIADLVVGRYADRIALLTSGDLRSLDEFKGEVDRALRPFMDYEARNSTLEIERCATQFIPTSSSASLARNAILSTTHHLCSSLHEAGSQTSLKAAAEVVQDLRDWLGWTTWKRCGTCAVSEVCFVPIWPLGGKELMERPKCLSNIGDGGRGYWGDFGWPPHDDRRDE